MARGRMIITSFNGGELSPLMDGRVDQDKYFTGTREQSNFIPTVQGPSRRRGGTRYVGAVKNSQHKTWLADFVFSNDQAYVLEFGDQYVRFWVNRAQLLDGSSPYEIVSPYAVDDLVTSEGTFALRTLQSADTMWIVHAEGKYPAYRLSRLGATAWTLLPEEFTDGPFRDINSSTLTMYASAAASVGASVTVTASAAAFLPGHVGSLLRLHSANPSSVNPYQPSKDVAANSRVRNAGNVYKALNAYSYSNSDTTQRYVPVHTEGEAFDGAVNWEYLHSGYGWGKITAVANDGLSCTLLVTGYIPEEVVGAPNATKRWQLSEFSSVYGWPTGVTFFKERLTYTRGKKAFQSFTNGFTSFDRLDAGIVTSETAMVLTLAADKLDNIRWAFPLKDLVIGTARAESAVYGQSSQQVYSATNVQNVPQSQYGSRLLRPLRVGDSVLFVERAGHRVRDMRFAFEIDRYKAEDISVLSEHLFDGSERDEDEEQFQRDIVDWAYQQQRDSIVWCVCSDGSVAGLVLNRERGVLSWTPHYFGGSGIVEAVQSIPSPDGRTDDAWFIVRREVNGQTLRTVEYMTDYRLVKKGVAEAVHVDCSYTYRGVATDTISGLTWLEGKTVSICVDGSNHPDKIVAGGQVTLDRQGSLVHVGYRYASRLQTMRVEMQAGGGTGQTAKKGFGELWLRLQSTVGGKVGPSWGKTDPIKMHQAGEPIGQAPKLYHGDYKLDFPGGFETDLYVCYEQTDPLPATLVAIVGRLTVND
jgi:hypothetical protein